MSNQQNIDETNNQIYIIFTAKDLKAQGTICARKQNDLKERHSPLLFMIKLTKYD